MDNTYRSREAHVADCAQGLLLLPSLAWLKRAHVGIVAEIPVVSTEIGEISGANLAKNELVQRKEGRKDGQNPGDWSGGAAADTTSVDDGAHDGSCDTVLSAHIC